MNQLWKKQASIAYGYSLTRLALNLYIYLEDMDGADQADQISQYDSRFRNIIGLYLQGDDCFDQLKAMRNDLQAEMEAIVALTDCFQNYEYALNRIERRVCDGMPAIDTSDEAFGEQLFRFVTGADEAAVMNQRIQTVVGQLPVRLTRQKFYSMVREALSVYNGSDRSGLEDMMYLLRTAAMTAYDPVQAERYPQLNEWLKHLKQLDFKTITAAEYKAADQLIQLAGEQLYEYSERFRLLHEIINDLYVLQLTEADAVRKQDDEKTAGRLIRLLLQRPADIDEDQYQDQIYDCLHHLEGVQEHYFEKYQRLEGAPEYCFGEPEWVGRSRQVERLLSTSTFAGLEPAPQQEPVDRAFLDQTATAFFAELDQVFANSQKPVVRAVMAAVLSTLPVCFNSLDEITSYIGNSLAACSDMAEKDTCKELLTQLMEMENNALL